MFTQRTDDAGNFRYAGRLEYFHDVGTQRTRKSSQLTAIMRNVAANVCYIGS